MIYLNFVPGKPTVNDHVLDRDALIEALAETAYARVLPISSKPGADINDVLGVVTKVYTHESGKVAFDAKWYNDRGAAMDAIGEMTDVYVTVQLFASLADDKKTVVPPYKGLMLFVTGIDNRTEDAEVTDRSGYTAVPSDKFAQKTKAIKLELNFKPGHPTMNGRIYSKDVLEKALRDGVSQQFGLGVYNRNSDYPHTLPIGVTTDLEIDDNGRVSFNVCHIDSAVHEKLMARQAVYSMGHRNQVSTIVIVESKECGDTTPVTPPYDVKALFLVNPLEVPAEEATEKTE